MSGGRRSRAGLVAGLAGMAVAMLGCLPLDACAWNAGGHRLTATLAWRQLDATTQQEIGRILAAHPDHAVWQSRSQLADAGHAAFVEASTWPDDIRRDARFHDDRDAPTAAIAGFPDMARHRRWHYVDQPLFGTHSPRHGDGELDRRLGQLIETLGKPGGSDAGRAYALSWLIHLVGDAHQPLHTVSRYDAAGKGDDGGNALWIDNPYHPRRRQMTLHAYWDDLPGPPWLRGSRLEAAADRLPLPATLPVTAGTPQQWLAEGRQLAETVVYAGLAGEVPSLDADYHERAQRTARERIAVAGKRLALVLEKIFGR